MDKFTSTNDGFKMVAGEAAVLKRQQLEREICKVENEVLRSNLLHTFSKLFMFLEEDIRIALKIAAKNPYKL